MKKSFLMTLLLTLVSMSASAAKTMYKPDSWTYNSSTQAYTESGVGTWYKKYSKETDNCILFWQESFGSDPTKAPSLNGTDMTFDPDAVLQVAETCYNLNVNTLGFSCSNMLNKYKIIILMNYTSEWTCYGGGYDFECSALWLNPATVKPAGHSLAHEVGHSFHYMAYAEAANYSHTSSSTINTGFHLNCGNGQAIWEQTAQWQANQAYPAQMFSQSYPLFGNSPNYAFSHEWIRYQSYWFHYYLSDKYSDKTIVSQIWKQPMTGQSNNGSATDFCQAFIKLKGLSAAQFYEIYFDYAMKCATYDFTEAVSYRNNYVGNFDYYCSQLGTKQYQVAYASAPQSTGFNVIELTVPSSGTTITTAFTALQHGCALSSKDPAQYSKEGSLVSAGVSSYNSAGTASYRGFRVGYVFLKSDGTRTYYNDGTVHCTGTDEKTENISTTVPANTSRIFLVVAPALTTYVRHPWDENILNDDQWPYRFTLTNTDLKSANVFTEDIPAEPEFTKVIDGRSISDVTLTYSVILPPDASGYTGAGVTLNAGNAVNALCTAFQMESSNIFNKDKLVDYTASQSNNTIMSCAVSSNGTIQAKANNTNGTYGHWFNASGTVIDWGSSCVAFTQIDEAYESATVGQYPGKSSNGQTRTIREALVYKNASDKMAKATFVYNITFKTGATPIGYLTAIDYDDPNAYETSSVTPYKVTEFPISIAVTQGEGSATYTLTSDLLSSDGETGLANGNSSALGIKANDFTTANFKGYLEDIATATSGNNVYYYLPDGVPATGTNGFTYIKQAPVTNDADFNGMYTYYFNKAGKMVKDASAAHIKVAYDATNMAFAATSLNNCPIGSYTVNVAMVRYYKSGSNNRYYVANFPVTVTVQSKPGETTEEVAVVRYPGQGYTAQKGTVDIDAAREYLGVDELTTDMLSIINPDGTEITAYSSYDGWFDATGTATTWGDNAKICVKFFQALDEGTYDICDMNGADEIGASYTVKWALRYGNKAYFYNITVTFEEKPAPELFYDAFDVIDTQEVNVESELGLSYEGLTATVDMDAIFTALGVSSISDVTVYAVQSDESLESNYGLGGTDGWRDAEGNFLGWSSGPNFCVKADFTLAENQIYYLGGMENKNTTSDGPVTYTARFIFADSNSKAVELKVNLSYVDKPLYLTDYTVLNTYNLELTTDTVQAEFTTDILAIDVEAIATALGMEDLSGATFFGTRGEGELTRGYTAHNGYYIASDGLVCGYSDENARFFVETDKTQLTIGQKPSTCSAGDTYTTTLYFGDQETSKLVQLNITYKIAAAVVQGDITDKDGTSGDGELDEYDVAALVKILLNKATDAEKASWNMDAANVDESEDGLITLSDLTALVNKIQAAKAE